jgi:hypothetical protein
MERGSISLRELNGNPIGKELDTKKVIGLEI